MEGLSLSVGTDTYVLQFYIKLSISIGFEICKCCLLNQEHWLILVFPTITFVQCWTISSHLVKYCMGEIFCHHLVIYLNVSHSWWTLPWSMELLTADYCNSYIELFELRKAGTQCGLVIHKKKLTLPNGFPGHLFYLIVDKSHDGLVT